MKPPVFKRAYKRLNFLYNDYLRNQYCKKRFLNNAINGVEGNRYEKEHIVCSITTIPSRIDFVKFPILSMINQTIRPDLIVLYIGKEQFKDIELPEDLLCLQERGLEIRYVDDVRVHTKYYYAFKDFTDSLVITVDDDIVYNRRLVENLIKKHINNPKNVICSRAHKITYENNGTFKSYAKWDWDSKSSCGSNLLVATGVGGVLYVPSFFEDIVYNSDLFLSLSPNNDDLWLKAVELISDIKVSTLNGRLWYAEIPDSQKESLNSKNVHNNKNDIYWANLMEYFEISKID